MPRPPESRIRRFMMQGIMWLILGATIGLAALVDRRKSIVLEPPLGDVTTLQGGISLHLPQGWVIDTDVDADSIASARDPHFDRGIEVRLVQPRWSSLLSLADGRKRTTFVAAIPFGDGVGELRSRQYETPDEEIVSEFIAVARLSGGRSLDISVTVRGYFRLSELEREKKLIMHVAASVQIPAEMRLAPTSQPAPDSVNDGPQ